jgi:hypothetical protein
VKGVSRSEMEVVCFELLDHVRNADAEKYHWDNESDDAMFLQRNSAIGIESAPSAFHAMNIITPYRIDLQLRQRTTLS